MATPQKQAIQKAQPTTPAAPPETLETFMMSRKGKIAELAPKYLNVERLLRLAMAAFSRNEKLKKCSKGSLLAFCIKCAETGTEKIGPGGAWPVPFWNNKVEPPQMDVQFISDYRNMIRVAKSAGVIKDAVAECVYENDEFNYSRGLSPSLTHVPTLKERGPLKFAYCIWELPDGRRDFRVLHEDDIARRRSSSRAADSGPWKTHEPEMWKKSAVRAGMSLFEGSAKEMDALFEADNDAEPIDVPERQPVEMPKELPAKTDGQEPPPPKEQTPQERLAAELGDKVTFDDFRDFITTKALVKDASSYASPAEVPTDVLTKFFADPKLLDELVKKFGKK